MVICFITRLFIGFLTSPISPPPLLYEYFLQSAPQKTIYAGILISESDLGTIQTETFPPEPSSVQIVLSPKVWEQETPPAFSQCPSFILVQYSFLLWCSHHLPSISPHCYHLSASWLLPQIHVKLWYSLVPQILWLAWGSHMEVPILGFLTPSSQVIFSSASFQPLP